MDNLAGESKMGFARRLSSPKKKTREKAVSFLVLWLTSQKELDEFELKKIWKGLFYCVWHSDKAPVQAELIERLASIFEKLDATLTLQFFRVFLVTMRREWAGIDRLRLDKFYLLLRKCLAHMFSALQTSGWHMDCTKGFMDILVETAFLASDQYAALGINLHYADVFLQELKNFLPLELETFRLLLEPFLVICARTSDKSLLKRIKENVFEYLFNFGRSVIDAKRDGNALDSVEEMLGSLLLSLPLGSEAFKLASLPSTSQANRKVLYELHRELEKLESLSSTSGITFSLENVVSKKKEKKEKKKKKKKKDKGLSPVRIIEKPTRKKIRAEKTVNSLRGNLKSALDEGIAPTVSVDRRKGDRRNPVLEKGNILSERKEGERRSESSTSIVPKEKDEEAACDKEKKKGEESFEKQTNTAVVESSAERPQAVVNGLGTYDSVVSKLEKQFDLLADDRLAKSADISPSTRSKVPATISLQDTSNKKRKRRLTTDSIGTGQETIEHPALVAEKESTPSTDTKVGNSSGKVKRVRFALKRNLVWTPSTPLPAENVRVPPSATPRGSALKKGVSPGPIVSDSANKVKNRKGTPMQAYKYRQNVLKQVKMLLNKELG